MTDPAEEAALLEKARKGSVEAFSELVRQHQTAVRTYVARFVREGEVANDVAQEVFLTAFRALSSFRGEAAFRFWLLGIARRLVLSSLRAEARRRTRETSSLPGAVADWHADLLEATEPRASRHERELAALGRCLEQLPKPASQLVSDHYIRGRSTVEIARQTGKRDSAIRMALTRLRRLLRECMERRLQAEGAGS